MNSSDECAILWLAIGAAGTGRPRSRCRSPASRPRDEVSRVWQVVAKFDRGGGQLRRSQGTGPTVRELHRRAGRQGPGGRWTDAKQWV